MARALRFGQNQREKTIIRNLQYRAKETRLVGDMDSKDNVINGIVVLKVAFNQRLEHIKVNC